MSTATAELFSEAKAITVSEEDRFLFDLQGFLLLKNVFSKEECRILLDKTKKLEERSYPEEERLKVTHQGQKPQATKEMSAADLSEAAEVPVDTLDERWTSREAERLLQPASGKRGARRRKKGAVDEMAASIILRTYLARRTVDSVNRNGDERSR